MSAAVRNFIGSYRLERLGVLEQREQEWQPPFRKSISRRETRSRYRIATSILSYLG
ncbi:MAG: hypothetical protein J2P37_36145 [Ktedonobacteraceae bacterium]|nr:hypothetical protein [Ktedonobacteraceae bacterium]